MSLIGALRLLRLTKVNITPHYYAVPTNGYAVQVTLGKVKKVKKTATGFEKKLLPVETDANKLVKYVCGLNIYVDGQDVEIKPDSEYPDWLWEIRTGPAPPLEQLDPNTRAYWKRVRSMNLKRKNIQASKRRF